MRAQNVRKTGFIVAKHHLEIESVIRRSLRESSPQTAETETRRCSLTRRSERLGEGWGGESGGRGTMADDRPPRLLVERFGSEVVEIGQVMHLEDRAVSTKLFGTGSRQVAATLTNSRCGRFITGRCRLGLSPLTKSINCCSMSWPHAEMAA